MNNECKFEHTARTGLYIMVWVCMLHAFDPIPTTNDNRQKEILQRIQRIEMFHGIDTNAPLEIVE